MGCFSFLNTADWCDHDPVQERLPALAVKVEAITRQIRMLGLSRAAEDLEKVATELRRLGREAAARVARDEEHCPPANGARSSGT
jgi:hypothetical protein